MYDKVNLVMYEEVGLVMHDEVDPVMARCGLIMMMSLHDEVDHVMHYKVSPSHDEVA